MESLPLDNVYILGLLPINALAIFITISTYYKNDFTNYLYMRILDKRDDHFYKINSKTNMSYIMYMENNYKLEYNKCITDKCVFDELIESDNKEIINYLFEKEYNWPLRVCGISNINYMNNLVTKYTDKLGSCSNFSYRAGMCCKSKFDEFNKELIEKPTHHFYILKYIIKNNKNDLFDYIILRNRKKIFATLISNHKTIIEIITEDNRRNDLKILFIRLFNKYVPMYLKRLLIHTCIKGKSITKFGMTVIYEIIKQDDLELMMIL